jgi:hypothetical protein
MRIASAALATAGIAVWAQAAPAQVTGAAARRLVLDSTNADTVVCGELHYQFMEIRGDPVAGNGFRVMVRNRTPNRLNFDPTQFRAQLPTGRQVSFLSAPDVAAQYLDPGRSQGLSNDDRVNLRRDIETDTRLRSGPIQPNSMAEKFLALGWSRPVTGDPASLLPMALTCSRQPIGRLGFAQE